MQPESGLWSTAGTVSLPAEVVNTESVNSFKNAYDRSCHKYTEIDDRSWSACQSINLQVQVSKYKNAYIKKHIKNRRLYNWI